MKKKLLLVFILLLANAGLLLMLLFLNKKVDLEKSVAAINMVRVQNGVSPLTEDKTLDTVAQQKACDMVNNNYFSHVSPTGKDFRNLLASNNYAWLYAGENIARGYSDDTEAMTAFLASPGHRENILDAHFTRVGVANCGVYYVQEFSTPEM